MPTRPMILLLIPHLRGGGAEHVTELLARHFSTKKYQIHLGLITQSCRETFEMPSHMTVHAIGARRVRYAAVRLVRLIWRLQPNIILCSMVHLNFLVLLLRPVLPKKTRILVRQNGIASAMLGETNWPALTHLLYRALYRRADGVICQTAVMAEDLHRYTGESSETISVLPNAVDFDVLRSTMEQSCEQWSGPGPHLLAVGRLSREKGFDLLLNALSRLKHSFPFIDLALAGNGSEEASLRKLTRTLGLNETVRFLGRVARPSTLFQGATLFVLSSRQEGLPNALLEAAAGGLPIVATPAVGGIENLIREKAGIWMARDVSADALADALTAALLALRPGERFGHDWVEAFRLELALPAYESLIDAVLAKGRP